MSVKTLLVEALVVFSATLFVSIIVTLLWNLVVHGTPSIDWETSCRLAFVFGIILPWVGTRRASDR